MGWPTAATPLAALYPSRFLVCWDSMLCGMTMICGGRLVIMSVRILDLFNLEN
jgi:hypothetical protein